MSGYQLNKQGDNHYLVEGELTFSSLNKHNTSNHHFLTGNSKLSIDLINVLSIDSAGLALIIDWIKQSKKQNTQLIFKNIPPSLLTLAELSGLNITALISQ